MMTGLRAQHSICLHIDVSIDCLFHPQAVAYMVLNIVTAAIFLPALISLASLALSLSHELCAYGGYFYCHQVMLQGYRYCNI